MTESTAQPEYSAERWGWDESSKFRALLTVIVLAVSFMPYYTITENKRRITSWSAWSGLLPFITLIMVTAASILIVILASTRTTEKLGHHTALISFYGVALLAIVFSFFLTPLTGEQRADVARRGIKLGRSFGFYADLISVTLALVASVRQLNHFRYLDKYATLTRIYNSSKQN